METPLSFAARITASFALGCLKPKSRVLDVGCGGGAIAAAMTKGGLLVTAIDPSQSAVEKTTSLGVTCFNSELEKFEHEEFDALLCSRSLHHMQPLDKAISAAHRLLKPNGLLLVEDFGYERVDQKTAIWLFNLAQLIAAEQRTDKALEGGKDAKHGHSWLTEERHESNTLGPGHEQSEAITIWRRHHEVDHHVSSFERVKNALLDKFEIIEERSVPYLFHYLCDLLPATKSGAIRATLIYNWERELAQVGGIEMCGARIIAIKS
ncbi:class I SAM-dependent methyltransferase [bacterium]|nr:class I SAM-dependent methyltransferase [bacterium]MBP9809943.1 class I SAM-dependent methyltransferase [bacterium]